MNPSPHRLIAVLLGVLVAAALVAAGCGSDSSDTTGTSADAGDDALVVYSGRSEEFIGDLLADFEADTGIELDVRYGDSAELSATLQEEGEDTPADVFLAQDAGAVGVVSDQLAPLTAEITSKVPEQYRAADDTWVGVTGRVRTLVYRTGDAEVEAMLPDSVHELTGEDYSGKVGVAPTNASFQAAVSAMRLVEGDEATLAWLEGLVANDVKTYEKNGLIVDAVAAGEIDMGLVNHYYVYEKLAEEPEAPVANHFFAGGDPGSFVNVSAVGILAASDMSEDAQRLVEYLLAEGQDFVQTAEEREYPLVEGYGDELPEDLPVLASVESPEVGLDELGEALPGTVELLEESGLLTS